MRKVVIIGIGIVALAGFVLAQTTVTIKGTISGDQENALRSAWRDSGKTNAFKDFITNYVTLSVDGVVIWAHANRCNGITAELNKQTAETLDVLEKLVSTNCTPAQLNQCRAVFGLP